MKAELESAKNAPKQEELHSGFNIAPPSAINNILIINGRMFFETNPGSGYIKL